MAASDARPRTQGVVARLLALIAGDTGGVGRRTIRRAWLAVLTLLLGVYVAGVPHSLANALALSPGTRAGLVSLGLPPQLPAIYMVTLDTLMLLAFAASASLIVWRRAGERMVSFTGLMLVLTALLYTAPLYDAGLPIPLLAGICALAEICQVGFVYLFPSGRFVPGWARLLLLPMIVWRPAIWGLVYLPNYLNTPPSGDRYGYLPQDVTDTLAMVLLFVGGVAVQAYRYRRVSNATERQQTKWLLFGVIGAVGVGGVYTIAINIIGVDASAGHTQLLLRMAGRTCRQLALTLVPLTLIYSVLRHRLWQIDALINRTLVYASLTGLLVTIYAASVVALQSAFRGVIGQRSDLAVIVATLGSASLFLPLRERVQQAIDRRFYRRQYDAAATLAVFGARLRQEVELGALRDDLLAVVEETVQPAHVSLWVCRPVESPHRLR